MTKVAPEKPEDIVSSPEERRSYLEGLLSQIEEGHRFGLQEGDIKTMRRAVQLTLEDLDDPAPISAVQLRVIEPAPEDLVTIPLSGRGRRGKAKEVTISTEAADVLSQYYSRQTWSGSVRARAAILAVIIDEGGMGDDSHVSLASISERTGYSVATIKSEISTLRTMDQLKIVKKKGVDGYTFFGRLTSQDLLART